MSQLTHVGVSTCSRYSVSTHSHNLVVDSDGNLILNDGKCLVSRISDGSVKAVEPRIISEVFGISFAPVEVQENYSPPPNSSSTVSVVDDVNPTNEKSDEELHTENNYVDRSCWTRNNILLLINLYKKHSDLFKTTTIRNEKVWNMIAKEMGLYTSEQCKNKFKYLKAKYIKKKDNMSIKATVQKRINFEYFEELDEIFESSPNVTPISIASSSKHVDHESDSDNEEIVNNTKCKKKKYNEDKENIESKPKLTVAGQLKKIAEEMKQREKNRERRHREIVEQREHGICVLNNYVTYIMEIDKKDRKEN